MLNDHERRTLTQVPLISALTAADDENPLLFRFGSFINGVRAQKPDAVAICGDIGKAYVSLRICPTNAYRILNKFRLH